MDDVDSEAARIKYQCPEKYEVSYSYKALFLLQQPVSSKCPPDDHIKTEPRWDLLPVPPNPQNPTDCISHLPSPALKCPWFFRFLLPVR